MKHTEWIMAQLCTVKSMPSWDCEGNVVAHHVRTAANSGTGMKPDDAWCVPLCDKHHKEGHQRGWKTFERKYGVDLKSIAIELAARSQAAASFSQED